MKRILIAILALLPLGYALSTVSAEQKTTRISKSLTIFNDVMRQVDVNYVDTLDYETLTETAINEMLRRIDPYTVYYPKKKDEDLKMMTTGKYGGIGAIIQQRGDTIYIANPYEGKPAQRHDVRAGDRILAIDGWNATKHTVKEVSDHLRGTPGTQITLTLRREGENKPIKRSFTREEVHMDPVEYACVMADSVGYISFSEFTEGSAALFTEALYDLTSNKGARSLILDLRGNGGGIVDEAIRILSNFLDKGTEVVSTKGKTPASCRSYTTSSMPYFKDLPLVVLVDKNSASASEIVSGSLQDLGRAKLVGERTFGKGLVQNVRPISYGGHIKVTTSKYYLPSGRCIQAIDYAERQKGKTLHRDTAGGILPDVVIADSQKVDITYALYTGHYCFDYATRYHREHATIASAETFELSDAELEDFCKFLEEKKFTYETETGKYLKELIHIAENEDIDSTTIAAIRELEPRLQPSFREAIFRNRETVTRLLGGEIVERYYYQRGRLAFLLRFDKNLEAAVNLLKKE